MEFEWHGHKFNTDQIKPMRGKGKQLKVTSHMLLFWYGDSHWTVPAGEVSEEVFEILMGIYKETIT